MLKFEKVATPLTALTVAVPLRVPLPGLLPIAMVTELVAVVTVLPFASSTLTVIAGAIVPPVAVLDGCTPNTSLVAAPGVMLNAELAAPVIPALEAARV